MRKRMLKRYIRKLGNEERDLFRRGILEEAEKGLLGLPGREEMKKELKETISLKSLPLHKLTHELTAVKREWKEFLVLFPETKTIQPELYNKILILYDVIEELIS